MKIPYIIDSNGKISKSWWDKARQDLQQAIDNDIFRILDDIAKAKAKVK